MLEANNLIVLIKNNFGNYVLQKILLIVTEPLRYVLISEIIKALNNIGDKKIIIKWKHICDSYVKEK